MLSQEQQMDVWIEKGRDVGILIVDATDITPVTWQSSVISQNGGTVKAGNNASTLTYNDDDYYNVRDESSSFDLIITPTIDGDVIADTNFLKSIEVQYSFRLKVYGTGGWTKATLYFEILKDTEWLPINQVPARRILGSHTTNWVTGIPLDDGGQGDEYHSPDEGDDTELKKYFTKDNGNYSELKGMRFRISGHRDDVGYAEAHIDYIKVIVGYHGDDVSPIMERITGSGISTITCADVSAWDETGVVENDGFKIGQNVRKVIQDISSSLGLEIEIVDPYDDETISSYFAPTGDGTNSEWDFNDIGHWQDVDTLDELHYIHTNVGFEIDEFTFDNWYLRPNDYIFKTVVEIRAKRSIVEEGNLAIKISWDNGDTWSSSQTTGLLTTLFVAYEITYDDLEIYEQSEVNAFEVQISSGVLTTGEVKVSRVRVKHYIYGPTFKKYMAREFKGNYCMEPLKAVCKLEGAEWYEDYINDKIVVVKKADLVDSGVDLTEADYDGPWEYEDDCNQVKSFFVFGKAEDNIFAKAVDETVNSYISKQLIDESITNVADAQEIADEQLALVNSKRPSIRLPLKVDNVALQLGTTVDLTFARPTITKTAYVIRKIERIRKGINDIRLTIWVGLGESSEEENVAKFIRDNMYRSHKSLTNRLISP